MKLYETYVTEIGEQALAFKDQNLMVLFGDEAPDSLREFCFMVKANPVLGEIVTGVSLRIGEESYRVIKVGQEVMKNLNDLGHITISFGDDGEEDIMGGKLYVECEEYPEVLVGTAISIETEE